MPEDSIIRALRMQGYAMLLAGNFPLSLKKKLLYILLNEINVKMSQDELKEIEDFFSPVLISSSSSGSFGPIQSHFVAARPPKFCPKCNAERAPMHLHCYNCGEKLTEIPSIGDHQNHDQEDRLGKA